MSLVDVDFTDKNLWKPDLDYSIFTDQYNLRSVGAAATGQVVVLNDIRGGATALLTKATVDAGSVTVDAKSIGKILANADVLNEVQGGGAFDEKRVLDKVAPKGVKGIILKKLLSGGSTKGQSAIISTNLIQGETTAKIVDATLGTTLDKVGAVTVKAENSSTISVENSAISTGEGAKSMKALQIANNTIGWERSNLLFDSVETLLGDFVDDTGLAALRQQSVFNVDALVTGSTIVSSADVVVEALSSGLITAVLDNKASAAFQSIAQTKSSSLALAIAGNKISNSATAKIDGGSSVSGLSVSVHAVNSAVIDTVTNVGASNKTATTYGTDVLSDVISAIVDDYKYTTKSGTPGSVGSSEDLKFGDKVRVETPEVDLDDLKPDVNINIEAGDRVLKGGVVYVYTGTGTLNTLAGINFATSNDWDVTVGKPGAIYQYMGADTDSINLATANFNDFGLWKLLNTEALIPAAFAQTALLAKFGGEKDTKKFIATGSSAKGGIVARNQINADVTASIDTATISSTGAVSVIADQVATIKAADISVITSENVTDGNASAAKGGVSVANTILGKTLATVKDSTINKGTGAGNDLTVRGTNAATIEATALSEMAAGGKVVNAVIAFNSIGWEPQNLFLDVADALIGSPEVAQALGNEKAFSTTASIVNSDVDVAGSISVTADNSAEITAVTGNEAKQEWENPFGVVAKYGAKGMSAGVVLAMNKVSAGASAFIDNTGSTGKQIEADGFRRCRSIERSDDLVGHHARLHGAAVEHARRGRAARDRRRRPSRRGRLRLHHQVRHPHDRKGRQGTSLRSTYPTLDLDLDTVAARRRD